MKLYASDPNKLEKVAKGMFELRLKTTTRFKVEETPADLLDWIYKFNERRYTPIGGNKYGHTWESIVGANQKKGLAGDDLYNKIISSSKTPLGEGDKMDLGLALYNELGIEVLPTLSKYRMLDKIPK